MRVDARDPCVLIPHGTELGVLLVSRDRTSAALIRYRHGVDPAPRLAAAVEKSPSGVAYLRQDAESRGAMEVRGSLDRDLVLGMLIDGAKVGGRIPRSLWTACAQLMASAASQHSVRLEGDVRLDLEV